MAVLRNGEVVTWECRIFLSPPTGWGELLKMAHLADGPGLPFGLSLSHLGDLLDAPDCFVNVLTKSR
jgi:hypothetical protein